jgi:hypothetical protein
VADSATEYLFSVYSRHEWQTPLAHDHLLGCSYSDLSLVKAFVIDCLLTRSAPAWTALYSGLRLNNATIIEAKIPNTNSANIVAAH